MSVQIQQSTELHPRHLMTRDRRLVGERLRLASRVGLSARERFADLRELLLASRPVLQIIDEGKPTQRVVFGAPTFRNVIENGRLV